MVLKHHKYKTCANVKFVGFMNKSDFQMPHEQNLFISSRVV